MGLVPTLTQLGYALGILLLAPLGDRHDRRSLITLKAAGLALALLACGLAPGVGMLLAASLVVGVMATMAQDIVPAAASLAPEAHRGRIVGTVMTGLLLGILLSRVASGLVAQQFGWRAVYGLAAVGVAAIGVASWRGLPHLAPTTTLGYGALMRSLTQLWQRHPALRRAAWAQGLLSVGFSAFWSTLAVMLFQRYQMGSATAGAFGLAGAAGALAAPLAGRLADRRSPGWVTRLGTGLTALSFAAMALELWLWLRRAGLAAACRPRWPPSASSRRPGHLVATSHAAWPPGPASQAAGERGWRRIGGGRRGLGAMGPWAGTGARAGPGRLVLHGRPARGPREAPLARLGRARS
jgi:predicted MFS family arabinose efflux permease